MNKYRGGSSCSECDEMQMKSRWVACLIVGLSVFSASVVLDSREVTYAESVVSMSSEDGRWIEGKHGEWVTDNNGKWYRNADGSYPHNGFAEVEGDTYYFDEHGYIKKGWITEGDKKYYLDESGRMYRSQWILGLGGYYYVKADGVLATNEWIGEYYVGEDGRWIENYKITEDWELPIM